MWNVDVNGIEVPECKRVEFFDRLLILHIQLDSQVLDKLKGLPSSGDKTFAINLKEDLVRFSCEACWLISFDLHGQIDQSPTGGCLPAARLTFGFKYSDKNELWPLVMLQKKALQRT